MTPTNIKIVKHTSVQPKNSLNKETLNKNVVNARQITPLKQLIMIAKLMLVTLNVTSLKKTVILNYAKDVLMAML